MRKRKTNRFFNKISVIKHIYNFFHYTNETKLSKKGYNINDTNIID